jgi:glycosyltransferase involved in cell wall biosynthesis
MRALIVSYAFPPVGGAGVQRVLKLVKYLPAHGVRPTVLTVADPSVPVRDASLERDVPAGVEVIRAKTFEPSYVAKGLFLKAARTTERRLADRAGAGLVKLGSRMLVPDPQVLWLPGAHSALLRRLSRRADDVVFISAPPFSQFWLAPLARLRRGTAVVLDYRDEWAMTHRPYEKAGARTTSVGSLVERALLRCAHAVTTATEAYRSELCARFDFLEPARVHAIPNGYDRDDFAGDMPGPSGKRFVLTYVGTIFPLTSARGLIQAVRLLHAREPELARTLSLRFIGRIVESEAAHFEGTEALGVERLGYLEHDRAIEELAKSHAAVCILDAAPGAERVYPAKIFEIMYLRRPCLVLAPEGALADLVRRHRVGEVVASGDADAISSALERMLRAFRDGTAPKASSPVDVERFDRRHQAGQFAEVFRSAVASASP